MRHTTADPVAEATRTALADAPRRPHPHELRDLFGLFGRNLPGARIDSALLALGADGRAQRRRLATAGRPAEVRAAGPEGHPAAAEPGSKPARQDRPAGTAAKRRALTPAGPSRATMDLARQLCWRAYPRPCLRSFSRQGQVLTEKDAHVVIEPVREPVVRRGRAPDGSCHGP